VADHVPVLIALYDAQTHQCLFANRGYARTFGSMSRRSLPQLCRGDRRRRGAADPAQVDRVLRDQQAASYERYLPGPDGQPRWIEVNLIPSLDADGSRSLAASC